MATPDPSRLDANQVLQGSYDEDRGRLRVDAESTIVNADIDVALDATEDNVAIADPDGDFLEVNPDGSINVVIRTPGVANLKNYYSESNSVGTGITTLVASYTASNGDFLQKIEFSGTNIAEFELVINGVTQDKKRTYFGAALNGTFDFNEGIKVPAGQIIQVFAVHDRPSAGDFNARIQILETI
jgi:hypothetical protein